MPSPTSASSWRSSPVVPEADHDLATLCKLAREARSAEVEFDWFFTRPELLQLREAVLDWSDRVVGRYAVFDARVLRAINAGLGEPNSGYFLREPKLGKQLPYAVECRAEGEFFRLRGHATFDLIFGYGHFGAGSAATLARLGSDLASKLTANVSLLGWDMLKFQDPVYRSVINAVYGLRTDQSGPNNPTPGEPISLELKFHGPFSAAGDDGLPCLFTSAFAQEVGVYLWTLPVGGSDRVWYVGQTRRGFGERTAEHIRDMLSGKYAIPVLDDLRNGVHTLEWSDGATSARWPETLPTFLLRTEELTPKIVALVRQFRFYVATIAGPPRLYDRAEGVIGRYFKDHTAPDGAKTLVKGIRLPGRISGEVALKLRVSGAEGVAGLPSDLEDF